MILIVIGIAGIIFGSLLQMPASFFCRDKEHINVFKCENCNHSLGKKSFIPLFGWLFTKGMCLNCNKKTISISIVNQILTPILFCVLYIRFDLSYHFYIYSLLTLVLIILTYIDLKIYEIPIILNIFICTFGIINVIIDRENWVNYIIGFFAISVPILLLIFATGGKAMGGGDCKLMAAAGLLLGWKLIIFAFFVACILGAVIHSIRIKLSNEDRVLAFGPYLALGIFIAIIWGERLIDWYLSLM